MTCRSGSAKRDRNEAVGTRQTQTVELRSFRRQQVLSAARHMGAGAGQSQSDSPSTQHQACPAPRQAGARQVLAAELRVISRWPGTMRSPPYRGVGGAVTA